MDQAEDRGYCAWEQTGVPLHRREFVAHLEVAVVVMPLSQRDDYVQVVLETVDHVWDHHVTRLVVLGKTDKCHGQQGSGHEKEEEKGHGGRIYMERDVKGWDEMGRGMTKAYNNIVADLRTNQAHCS